MVMTDDAEREPILKRTRKASFSRRQLGVLPVAMITYFNVSGGPWGSEPIISSCGPLIGILAVSIFPWIWCLPTALLFAELFSAFPTDSSFCTWVGLAFGRPMGFHVGFWSWVGGVIDNAIYPCLIVDSIYSISVGNFLSDDGPTNLGFGIKFASRVVIAILFMLPTLFSIKIVGRTMLVLAIVVALPFLVMVFVAIPQINPSHWLVVNENRNWVNLISVLYWNYSGFDAAGAYAGEIVDPKRTYPRAMVLTVVMIALTYIIPFFAISGVDKPHYTTWVDGSYTSIALGIGGTWLCVWVVISNLFGNLGLYVAEMTKDGFQLAGMADSGLAPSFFSVRDHATGTPRRSIFLSFTIIVFMCLFDFDTILGVDNFLSALSSVVEIVAAVRLRYTHPEIDRPYKVGLSDSNLTMAMAIPFLVGVYIVGNELFINTATMVLCGVTLVIGVVIQRWLDDGTQIASYFNV
ncbi:unnamed protein product [Aphanomyces euteiches]|uniref:Amino acid permease/ SLC12A domain-containing protein n=1 Tax=Aphanomyces euteiches TaxID=100861 RepID=A0A6G0XNF5_9STRA|nr:hypothetical protein Ae201684_002948 [Aphanomyces euteiches]KAH9093257.1 hypothetical protein Ae201684P_008916 [Aphanomyces euteiches]KAH9104145.1 hypothetical protein AeMF1_019677 [Aphanomyces euteiches]KAH9109824.1 hypothetical protein LEN26_013927 [Aphanomyces euteiches]KAH9140519.1 hypothetical protein AeRB84_015254 [Aphanomyces euteiches]